MRIDFFEIMLHNKKYVVPLQPLTKTYKNMRLRIIVPFLASLVISSAFISCSDDNDGGNNATSSADPLMVESFVLDRMDESTITRSGVGVDFRDSVKFLVYFQNNGLPQGDRNYDLGVALYNTNKQRLRTFPLYEDIKCVYGSTLKMDDKIQISKDLSNGTYLLKPICKVTGEKEWQDMKLADDFALSITISDKQAQMKEAFKDIIKLMNIAYNKTEVAQNEKFKVTLDLYGNNTYKSIPIFLAKKNENGTFHKLTGETWTPDYKGEGSVTLSYAPTEVGKHTYYILSPVSEEPLTQFSIITKGQTYDIAINNIANHVDDILEDNSLKGTFTVKNYDDQVFSKEIYVMLITIDMNTFEFKTDSLFEHPQEYKKIQLSTASLGEEKIEFTFSNLNYDSYYGVTYGIKGKDGKFVDISGDKMFMLYTTPPDPSASEDGAVLLRAPKVQSIANRISYVNGKKVMWKK